MKPKASGPYERSILRRGNTAVFERQMCLGDAERTGQLHRNWVGKAASRIAIRIAMARRVYHGGSLVERATIRRISLLRSPETMSL